MKRANRVAPAASAAASAAEDATAAKTEEEKPVPSSSPSAVGAKSTSQNALKKESEAPPIIGPMVAHNYRQVAINRHLAAVVAGSVAGVFGLEGLPGLFVFILVTLLGACLMVAETGFQCKSFFTNPKDIFFAQFFTAALTFILVWTLVYNVVYIF
ncbi:hypothetical protein BESB_082490 [Besnoitia besnoiti]|uniref:ER membrane protein complex subunit 6 n=1 Tax=Besnoitia besnoiti TaxID=94643 RepID=A0A2A9MCD0_BESBE|nr:hypothetical protein BESB_082490 [Besnoitia besnoiti]PFH33050.1 hypothetical protein BESB_082490 [Besnoitia besnoiti]